MPPSPVPTALRKDDFENFRGFSRNSQKFPKFENENEGYFIIENLLKVILENSRNSRMRMRVTFSRVLASLIPNNLVLLGFS